jgi:hypothetical protein
VFGVEAEEGDAKYRADMSQDRLTKVDGHIKSQTYLQQNFLVTCFNKNSTHVPSELINFFGRHNAWIY